MRVMYNLKHRIIFLFFYLVLVYLPVWAFKSGMPIFFSVYSSSIKYSSPGAGQQKWADVQATTASWSTSMQQCILYTQRCGGMQQYVWSKAQSTSSTYQLGNTYESMQLQQCAVFKTEQTWQNNSDQMQKKNSENKESAIPPLYSYLYAHLWLSSLLVSFYSNYFHFDHTR